MIAGLWLCKRNSVCHFPDSEDQPFSLLLKINLSKQVYNLFDGLGNNPLACILISLSCKSGLIHWLLARNEWHDVVLAVVLSL